MVKSDERLRVLKMVQENKITSEEAFELLKALEESEAGENPAPVGQPAAPQNLAGRWLYVRVTDTQTGKARVNVRIPLRMVSAGLRMGKNFAPQVEGLDMDALTQFIASGEVGQIVDVQDEEHGEHVEVFID